MNGPTRPSTFGTFAMHVTLCPLLPLRFGTCIFPAVPLKRVWQFKISLKEVTPPVWRVILVPEEYTFWDLHVAIQDAMGWLDCHLHEFQIRHPDLQTLERIGIPQEEPVPLPGGDPTLPGWQIDIADYFSDSNTTAKYLYDFGDGWEHDLVLENVLQRDSQADYPLCLAGERACPPEDCGGPPGYERFLEAIRDETHVDHDGMLKWVGGRFSPEEFDPMEVRFSDPVERWRIAFDDETLI